MLLNVGLKVVDKITERKEKDWLKDTSCCPIIEEKREWWIRLNLKKVCCKYLDNFMVENQLKDVITYKYTKCKTL